MAGKMQALVYQGDGRIRLEERPVPQIQDPRDAILRVTLTTICSSDIHIKRGAVPRALPGIVLGHEFVGVVETVGEAVQNIKPGDRVAVNVETHCGECFYCKKGYVNNCADPSGGWALGCRIDGGQAGYARIPFADHGLNKIPDGVSDEQALFTGDLLSTGYWAASLCEIRPGDCVAVIGAGPAGLCSMMAARLYRPGCIVALDLDEGRLALAKRQGLADLTVNPAREDAQRVIRSVSEGRGADAVIEAAGGKDTFQTAWQIARPNAVICVAAMYEEDQILPLPQMYGKNLIFKTGGVDANDCGDILALIENKLLDATCLITHRTDFSHILEAYEIFEQKADGVVKWAIHL